MSSFRKINYKLRPAKAVERKMIAESFRKLSIFYPLVSYQYIGFGSIYFVDFSLFHKTLGISKLISIEKDETARNRVEFNRPFSCIAVHFDTSNNILPGLDYSDPALVWLDYDGKLNTDCLVDVNTISARCSPGTVFLVTVNVQAEALAMVQDDELNHEENRSENPKNNVTTAEHRLLKLQEQVSRARVPANVTGKELNTSGLPLVIKEIVHNEIMNALDERNGPLPQPEKLHFRQLYNIKYNDGANMLTFGGVFLNSEQLEIFDQANFFELPYCTSGTEPYQIKVPNLTNKEVVLLDSRIHEAFNFETAKLRRNQRDLTMIPESEIESYAQIYRFYPTFTESIW